MAAFSNNLGTVFFWGYTSSNLNGVISGTVSRSGNTVTLSGMRVTLSGWPSGAYGSDSVSFTVNGTATGFTLSANQGSFSLNNTSFSVGATDTSRAVSWSSSDGYSGSFTVTFDANASEPTGLKTEITGRTWNSITLKTSVSSWGKGTGSNRLVIHVSPTKNNETYIRQAESTSSPFTATLDNSSSSGSHTAFTMKGCHTLYPYIYAYNGAMESKKWGDAMYLPPAPLQSVTAGTQTYSGTNVARVVTITGGNSTNNNSVNVLTQYRYKVGSGSYSGWDSSLAQSTPWTAKTPTITTASNSEVTVEARQVYQSQISETKTLTYNTKPLSPSVGGITAGTRTGLTINFNQNEGGKKDALTVNVTILSGTTTVKTGTATVSNGKATLNLAGKWITAGTTYTIKAYTSGSTVGSSDTITDTFTVIKQVKLYGSVNELSKKVEKLYGPVNGDSEEIIKLYCSVDQESAKIYEKE